MAAILYITTSAIDYRYTIDGIKHGLSPEGNPVAQLYIELFGLEKGLLIYKIVLVTLVIAGAKIIDIVYARKANHPGLVAIPYWILCIGASLTLLAVGLWIKLFLSS
ncbi:MAG: hypothetical protein PHN39_03895 [Candidatus Pacebacteria bacterium]|nr:hypothetical protein [Candidatus Paceibacterota bacterium]